MFVSFTMHGVYEINQIVLMQAFVYSMWNVEIFQLGVTE